MLLSATAGVFCIVTKRTPSAEFAGVRNTWLAVVAAIVLQLVPLPSRVLATISPTTDRLLSNYDLSYATLPGWHALSIDPPSTALGLLFAMAFGVFTLGVAMRLNTRRAAVIARAVAVLAVLVAVIGVVQKASGTSLIYGFWRPFHNPYQIFGPFVNKNHYAGWMIMALSLTLGSLASAVAGSARRMPRDWRDRLLWLSSPDANYIAFALVAVPVMAVALLMTLSRSGIAAFAAAVGLAGACVLIRARRSRAGLTFAAVYAIAAMMLIIGWSRLDAVGERFEAGSSASLQGRLHTWSDAARIARDFPVAGTGLNTFDPAMIFYQSQPGGHWDFAHNDYVQLLAEGGILLCVPIAIAVVVLVRHIGRRLLADANNPESFWLRFGAALGLVAIALQASFDFSLQLPGNAIFCALLVGIALHGQSGLS